MHRYLCYEIIRLDRTPLDTYSKAVDYKAPKNRFYLRKIQNNKKEFSQLPEPEVFTGNK